MVRMTLEGKFIAYHAGDLAAQKSLSAVGEGAY